MLKEIISEQNIKLSKFVIKNCENLSYSAFMKLLRNKDIKVNDLRVKEDVNVKIGDKICVYYTPNEAKKFDIVYKDENIIIVNKKCGYLSESVFNDIKNEYINVGFIHRLDRNTSGLLVFSLNADSEKELLFGFKNRTFEKYYYATVFGVPTKSGGVFSAYLKKDKDNSKVLISENNKEGFVPIKTGYKIIKTMGNKSLLEVKLYTGKTHQIRAHLAFLGYPIVGDGKYGNGELNKKEGVKTQQLVAQKIVFHFENTDTLFYLNNKTFTV